MDDCIFCKIVAGAIPCYKVYEDEHYLGFMDIKPLNIGNTLLIPKNHHRWVYDVPDFGQYFEIAKKIALATMPLVNATSTSFVTLGFEVPHAHIRIIPRFEGDSHSHGIDTNSIVSQTTDELKRLADKISEKVPSLEGKVV